ncbi:hypothetical protein [Rhizobium jaguaris]|uniref:hypothetical protein n=1 Tax=Rhizobium jaguaris TaxID=1312183 RepID=UPI0013C530CE|nr:hypothetical protein [Rhizobium jaguaris]
MSLLHDALWKISRTYPFADRPYSCSSATPYAAALERQAAIERLPDFPSSGAQKLQSKIACAGIPHNTALVRCVTGLTMQ